MKWIGLALLLIGIGCALFFGNREYQRSRADAEIFHELWQKDLDLLRASKKLPDGWKSLRVVEYVALDQDVWKWIEHKKPEFNIDPEGQFRLEVLIDHFDDEEGKAALVEYHLIDLKSGDKVWELGRTVKIRSDSSPNSPAPTSQ
jgi:hypothetical protein